MTRHPHASPVLARGLSAVVGAVALGATAPVAAADAPAAPPRDGLHDFDFVIGTWNVHLRKLMRPLTGSSEWVEYTGRSVMTKLWGERANMEEFDVTSLDGKQRIEAQTLRLYDPQARQWHIYLLKAAEGKLLLPATVGAFQDGRGEFHDREEFGGRSILVRYVWTQPTPATARMEQSFSPDWGRTWEVNWICDLSPKT